MGSKPKAQELPDPAKRPERTETLEPDDIELGVEEEDDPTKRGRRALRRPTGGGGGVGTGLVT